MKILGIDYGRKKIGLAVGDSGNRMAEPLFVSSIKNYVLSIKELVIRNNVKKIVIGVPGGKMDDEIKIFGERAAKETGLPVEFFDETLSTQDAQKMLIESGGKRKKRCEKEDAVAAAVMLQWYLEGGGNNV